MSPDRIIEKMSPKTRIVISFAILALIFTVIAFGFLYFSTQNRNRINEIQASRIESCERTYRAFGLVFKPFFPPEESQTEEQKKDLKTLEKTINRLVNGCTTQTNPDNKKGD